MIFGTSILGAARRRNVVPVISGFAFPGEVLTSTVAGQWRVNGVDVSGETGSTYTVNIRDIGLDITCGAAEAVRCWHPYDPGNIYRVRTACGEVYNGDGVPAQQGETVAYWGALYNNGEAINETDSTRPIFESSGFGAGLPGVKFPTASVLIEESAWHYSNVNGFMVIVAASSPSVYSQMVVGDGAAQFIVGGDNISQSFQARRLAGESLATKITDDTAAPNVHLLRASFGETYMSVMTRNKTGTASLTLGTTVGDPSTIIMMGKGHTIGVVIECSHNLSDLNIRRLRQYAGRCVGIDMGLAVES